MNLSGFKERLEHPSMNITQFVVGSMLYFFMSNTFFPDKFLLGLIGYIIAYQSVYQYNDLIDYEDDVKDDIRRKSKPLVSGEFSREDVESFSFVFPIIGLSICFFVNTYFGLLVATVLLLNFLHSSPYTRFKKTVFLYPNLFIIEFLKFSLGWFVFSLSFERFPFTLITLFVLIYMGSYIYWKNNVSNLFEDKRLKAVYVIGGILYIVSVATYPFKLPLIMPVIVGLIYIIYILLRRVAMDNTLTRVKVSLNIVSIIKASIVISMLLMANPTFAQLNENISERIDGISENITNALPDNIKPDAGNVDEKITENLNKISEIKEIVNIPTNLYPV